MVIIMDDLANIKVTLGSDRMCAYISVDLPEKGQTVKREDIKAALSQNGVMYGVKDDIIERIVTGKVSVSDVPVAEGKNAEHGIDGFVEYLFSFNDEVAPKVMQDGRVDYYDMNIIHPVMKGDVLCRLHPPTPGKDGVNVLGYPLFAKAGKPAQMPRGRNTQASDSGDELLAAIDGQIKHSGKNIDIVMEFVVQKNVDFSTGNIHFPGSVTIKGNVLSGFVIQSGGDVVVNGFVEKASITAVGNIILHGGMTGQGTGVLRAGGNVYAKYVENSHITASGNITAECIMHSTVRAGGGIELIGQKGLLVGGSAKARDFVKAVTVGSQFATLTEIEVGSDPKLNDQIKEIKAEMQVLEAESKKSAQTLATFRAMESAGTKFTPEKALLYDRTIKISEEQYTRLAELRRQHDAIETIIGKNERGFVRVSNKIYYGVKVTIATNTLLLKEDLSYCTLKNDGDTIRVAAY